MDAKVEGRGTAPCNEGKPSPSFAHEINNPVEALLNLIFLLRDEVTTEKGCEYLALAGEEVQRLRQIAHAAIAEYRCSAGLQKTNIPQMLASVLLMYKSRFDSRGISVETRFCDDGTLPVYAVALRQALTNLLLNAADAMPNGGTMHVRVAHINERGGQERSGLHITIADTGVGIDEFNRARIGLHKSFTTKGTSGNGVGLSIVHETVSKHEGVLRLRSSTAEGHSGSVFTIFLPHNHES